MMKTYVKFVGVLIFIFIPILTYADKSTLAVASPKRISTRLLDEGRVHELYITPGMASVIDVPSPITRIIGGSPDDLQIIFRSSYPREVVLTLRSGTSKPTNLFLMLGKRKLIFDIHPSYTTHQDLVEVIGSFGGPE